MTGRTPIESGLDLRHGDFATLTDALDYAAKGKTGLNFYSTNGTLETALSYRELRDDAIELAKRLVNVAPKNALIGLIAETSVAFARAFYACQYAGLVPVPVPMPAAMGGRESYIHQLRQMLGDAKVAALLAPTHMIDISTEALSPIQVPIFDMTDLDLADGAVEAGGSSELRPFDADDLCYIQYSSGSTNAPKGVIGSQRSVTANCQAIITHGLKVRGGDRAVSWLPLYHDMGLIGFFVAPMMAQLSIDLLASSSFARRPLTWLTLISENRGTLSYSPTFGYELAVKRWRNDRELDLSCWRAAGIGGDMVRSNALEAFFDTFKEHGFSDKAFVPSYGMAEATLALAFAPLGTGAVADEIDNDRLGRSGEAIPASDITQAAARRTFMLCGEILPGHKMEVRGRDGQALGDRMVGDICVYGPSISPGYYENEEATKAALTPDGWLHTGDLGYMLDGQIVITGRSKDLIITHGRNIWPQDLEWAVEGAVSGRIGRTAAFPVTNDNGSDEIILLVECRSRKPENLSILYTEAKAAARLAANTNVHVGLVPLSSLIVTSSGKISRARARQKYLGGGFEDLAAAELGANSEKLSATSGLSEIR
ncbi:MAG: fatty acyl-AMP ligase [Hyphomonadaceae bacterium]